MRTGHRGNVASWSRAAPTQPWGHWVMALVARSVTSCPMVVLSANGHLLRPHMLSMVTALTATNCHQLGA